MQQKSAIIQGIIVLVIIVALLVFNQQYLDLSPGALREWVLQFGWYGPVIFILLSILRPLTLFPSTVFLLAAGLAFGAFWGSVWSTIGTILGLGFSFLVARRLGRERFPIFRWEKLRKVEQELEVHGYYYVLMIRLIPFINYEIITYPAALSRIDFRSFFIATAIGTFPGIVIHAYLGAAFVEGSTEQVVTSLLLFALPVIASLLVGRYVLRRKRENKEND